MKEKANYLLMFVLLPRKSEPNAKKSHHTLYNLC